MYDLINDEVVHFAETYDGTLFHAMLTDPPYHLTSITKRFGKQGSAPAKHGKDGAFGRLSKGFMGQEWDGGDVSFRPETWAALYSLLLPGAFCMAFGGSRTYHRMAVAIEDAGFIIHPSIFWIYSQGFHKATRIDNQIDKKLGKEGERKIIGEKIFWEHNAGTGAGSFSKNQYEGQTGLKRIEPITEPATDLAKAWVGHRYGTQALLPAAEPIIVFQKPYEGKPVDCMVETGAGALNIEAGRIGIDPSRDDPHLGGKGEWRTDKAGYSGGYSGINIASSPEGRFPKNLVLTHSPECKFIGYRGDQYQINRFNDGSKPFGEGAGHEYTGESVETQVEVWECADGCPVKIIDQQGGYRKTSRMDSIAQGGQFTVYSRQYKRHATSKASEGYASHFFYAANWSYEIAEMLDEAAPMYYCAKASPTEREAGLDDFPKIASDHQKPRANDHPTLKPIALLRYLAGLLLPPDLYAPRRILVPFAGTGSEMIGAWQAQWDEIIGVEWLERYCDLGRARLDYWANRGHQLSLNLFAEVGYG